MKKFVSVLLSVIMVLSVFSMAAFAVDDYADVDDYIVIENYAAGDTVSPIYGAGDLFVCSLSFSGRTATCESSVTVATNEKWLYVTQTIEKEVSSNNWQSVKDAGWTETNTDTAGIHFCVMQNSKYLSESGTYRLKTVYTLEGATGIVERIVRYSLTYSI